MSGQRVIKLLHRADGYPSMFDNHYVVEYDPSRPGVQIGSMNFHLITTPLLAEATRFNVEQATALYRQIDSRRPVRGDGKPNRPLTAFHVMLTTPELAEEIPL